jgi:hypothetical protein
MKKACIGSAEAAINAANGRFAPFIYRWGYILKASKYVRQLP